MKLPSKLIKVIMDSISSTNMKMLWKGTDCSTLKPKKCIRQDDPISPYIFVMFMDHVKTNLESWKGVHLSFVGRITLAKAIIKAIPTYSIMTSTLPKASLKEIQKAQRAFIWGDSKVGKKVHIVSWDNITKPKCMGGLRIRNLIDMNRACLFKLEWSLNNGYNSLGCQVLQGKYDRNKETSLKY